MVFTHVMLNMGIKTGRINMENVGDMVDKYTQIMKDCFGFKINKIDEYSE